MLLKIQERRYKKLEDTKKVDYDKEDRQEIKLRKTRRKYIDCKR